MTCSWEPDPACLGDVWAALSTEVQARSLMLATSALQTLTLNRVGTCPITIRPCPEPPRCERGCGFDFYSNLNSYASFVPYLGGDGLWYNTCSACGHKNPCKPLSEINIPGPVGYIESFKIGGVEQVLDSGDWRLDDGHLLVWQGSGPSPVPTSQDLNLPDTQPGTWSITYSRSYPVLDDAKMAVAYLAVEFAKACTPKAKCTLPRGVTSVVRSGVSFTISAGMFPGGLTNIDIVDTFILKWAPAGAPTQAAVVFDPSKRQPRRTNSVPLRGSV